MGTTALSIIPAHAATIQTSGSLSQSDPRAAALVQAESTDQPVTIDSLTTADSETQALPDGTFATTTTLLPTRMHDASGAWESIDPTLVQKPDGSIATSATPNTLTLSSGGTGPLVTATDPAGHSFSLTLPISLPTPALSGTSATYTGVYPGVNLTVTARPTGGFSEVFEVQNASALAQTQNLKFTTQTSGLTVSQGSTGELEMADAGSGAQIMAAPPAIEWDSASDGAPADNVPDDFETVTNPASSAAGPGLGAHTGTLPLTDSGNTLTLTGSTSTLDTASPTYPLYLDPTYTWTEPFQSGGTNKYTEVQSGCPNVANYDDVTEPGVGYNDINGDGNCPGYGAYETYFDLNTANLNSQDIIESSTMKINEVYSADNNCNEGSENITVKWTGGFGDTTTWNSRPTVISTVSSKAMKTVGNSDGSSTCAPFAGDFDLKSAIASNAANNATHITFGLFGDESGSWESLERFNDNPSVYTVYDIKPNAPTNPTTYPTPITGFSSNGTPTTSVCPSSTAPGYMGIGNIGGQDTAKLSATLTSLVAAAQMQATFYLTDTTSNTTMGPYTSPGYVTNNAPASVQNIGLTDGHAYTWYATSYDEHYSSAASTTCYLQVDLTPPTNPTVASTSFPPSGSGTNSTTTGQNGTFTLSAADPAPSSGSASGLAGFYYSYDTPVPANGASFIAASAGSASLAGNFSNWGTHTLYVEAVDEADNRSGQSQYSFFVPQNTSITDTAGGNLTTDNVPDLVTTTPDGNLVDYPANTDPQAAPQTLSIPRYTPGYSADNTDKWSNYLVTHRGNFTSNGNSSATETVDDLWIYNKVTHNLYVANNSGTNPFENPTNYTNITRSDVTQDNGGSCYATKETDCTGYNATNWAGLTQLLAVGDLYTGSSADVSPHYDLLTVENDALWLYQSFNGHQFYLTNPVKLGTTGWTNTTLIAPGLVGNKPTLWARDNATGKIYSYTITFGTADGYPNSLGAFGSTGTVIATGFTASAYPALSSPGTLAGAAGPALFAVDGANHLDYFAGTSAGTPSTTGTYIGAIDAMVDRWPLADSTCASTAGSATGQNNATVHGAVTCGTPVTDTNNPPLTLPAFGFDGTTAYAQTTGPVIDTSQSFTISAWAYPTAGSRLGQIASLCGVSRCALSLQENANGQWEFAAANSDASTSTVAEVNTGGTVALNTWTHIVGVYDANAKTVTLYVNGGKVGTNSRPSAWTAAEPPTIGGSTYTASTSPSWQGALSDIRLYTTPLSQTQVTALYNSRTANGGIITQLD